ncbi:GNAT family N-acetyltransferase [Halomonadaceae bacterium KBTZ08]
MRIERGSLSMVLEQASVRRAVLDDVPAIASVHVAAWQSAYAGILPDEVLAALSVENRAAMWEKVLAEESDAKHLFVAESADAGIVGFAALGPEGSGQSDYESELYAIYILEAYQRQGIGLALFQAAVNALLADGFRSMIVWVLADNTARYFYEALGGSQAARRTVSVADTRYSEIGYGWAPLTAPAS